MDLALILVSVESIWAGLVVKGELWVLRLNQMKSQRSADAEDLTEGLPPPPSLVRQLHPRRQPEAPPGRRLRPAGPAAQRRPLPAAVQDALPHRHRGPVHQQLLR